MLIKEFISQVKEDLNSLSFDDYIPDEYIYEKGLNVFDLIIKRESDSRKLWNDSKIFTTIKCFEMEEIDATFCNESLSCSTINKSVLKIPLTYNGNTLQITDVFGNFVYKESSPSKYNISVNRGVPIRGGFYWIENEYLIIPGKAIPSVQLRLLTKSYKQTECQSMLDVIFAIPDYLQSAVVDGTVKKILETRKRIPVDENTDMNTNSK